MIYPPVFENDTNPEAIKYLNESEFIYYKTSNNTLCVIKSPCSHIDNKDLFKENNYGYILFVDKKIEKNLLIRLVQL